VDVHVHAALDQSKSDSSTGRFRFYHVTEHYEAQHRLLKTRRKNENFYPYLDIYTGGYALHSLQSEGNANAAYLSIQQPLCTHSRGQRFDGR